VENKLSKALQNKGTPWGGKSDQQNTTKWPTTSSNLETKESRIWR